MKNGESTSVAVRSFTAAELLTARCNACAQACCFASVMSFRLMKGIPVVAGDLDPPVVRRGLDRCNDGGH